MVRCLIESGGRLLLLHEISIYGGDAGPRTSVKKQFAVTKLNSVCQCVYVCVCVRERGCLNHRVTFHVWCYVWLCVRGRGRGGGSESSRYVIKEAGPERRPLAFWWVGGSGWWIVTRRPLISSAHSTDGYPSLSQAVCVCVCVCVAAWGEHLIWSVNMIIEHMSMDFLHVFRPAHLPWRLLRRLSDADVEQRRHYLVSWGRFCVQEDVQLFVCCHDVFPKDYRQLRHEAGRNLIWILKWITQSHCELANES